jgi:hypothetical protein
MVVPIFLALSALVWLPYGLYCLADPGSLAQSAGVASSSATGTTELRAMYGGLQAALGGVSALAVLRPSLRPHVLFALATLAAGLFAARSVGVLLDGGPSAYTGFALLFEIVFAVTAGLLYRRVGPATARA